MIPQLTKEYLEVEYWQKGLSPSIIAAALGTYPNAVRRALLRFWPRLRNHREAQQAALRGGRSCVPRLRSHRMSARAKISAASRARQVMQSPEQREAAQSRWQQRSERRQKQFSAEGREIAARTHMVGSKAERFLLAGLRESGFVVEHRPGWADLVIPSHATAIFVDGRPLFEPVFGEERLRAAQQVAAARRQEVIGKGWHVIRLCVHLKWLSFDKMHEALTKVIEVLKSIQSQSPQFVEIHIGQNQERPD